MQWLSRRIDDLHNDVTWLKERIVLTDAQLTAILEQTKPEHPARQLQRSNSYWGVFGLSR
jgi:hypothetical protein